MKRAFVQNTLGLVFGLIVGNLFMSAVLYAQGTPKITATGGWNLCVDAPGVPTLAEAQAITVTVDGTAVPGVTWTGNAAPYTAQIPLSQLAASYRTVAVHSAAVAFSGPTGTPVILADGSTLQPTPGTPLNVSYEVVAVPTSPSPTNPRWIKIAGTIIVIVAGVIVALFAHGSHG